VGKADEALQQLRRIMSKLKLTVNEGHEWSNAYLFARGSAS
jgi:hypothetical protein